MRAEEGLWRCWGIEGRVAVWGAGGRSSNDSSVAKRPSRAARDVPQGTETHCVSQLSVFVTKHLRKSA